VHGRISGLDTRSLVEFVAVSEVEESDAVGVSGVDRSKGVAN